MPAVPVMIQALLAHSAFNIEKTRSLHSVYLSGTLVQLSLVELCKTRLDAKYAIPTFGMTEGVDAILWPAGIEPKVHESHCGLGTVAPGAKIRVCPPGSRSPVRRGELGELHVSNPRMIKGYINVKSESFYTGEDGKTAWFVTGDQAMMDDEGVVYIMGRYKDLIIRGGENISAAAVESCMGKMNGVAVSSSHRFWLRQICLASNVLCGGIPFKVALYKYRENWS